MRHRLSISVSLVAVSLAIAVQAQDKALFNGKDLTGWTQVGPGNSRSTTGS